jgi:tetraacyldisaccharide 4'-kinase
VNPISAIYGAVTGSRNLLYDRGLLRARRLRGPVVSVGNLVVGGSGKTPFVILLGEQLKARRVDFDILSRGYGRTTRGVLLVDPAGSAKEFGDEPLLLARRLQVPVVLGERRYQAGLFAERKFGPQLHLLDDGFQHRSLARDFDIVLVSAADLQDRLLPLGRLREPIPSLHRADAIVLTNEESPPGLANRGQALWRVWRGLRIGHAPPNPIAFCGIARPENFFAQLRQTGVEPAAEIRFRDHHSYSQGDLARLLDLSRQRRAGGFLTTEKDAINLDAHRPALEPLTIASVVMEFESPPDAVDTMLRIVSERKHRP